MKRIDITKIYRDYAKLLKKEDEKIIWLSSIAGEINSTYLGSKSYLDFMARTWDESIHFYEGDQYLYYNDVSNQFETIPMTRDNDFIPRSVTNYIFPIVQTMTSILTKNKPACKVVSNSTSNEDNNRAHLVDLLLDAKWELDKEGLKHLLAAKLIFLTGTAYRKDWFDTSGLKEIEIPGDKKLINPKALSKGIEIETKEHPELEEKMVRQLVIDHLKENPDEYGEFEEEKEIEKPKNEKNSQKDADDEPTDEEINKKLEDSDLEYQEDPIKVPIGDNKVSILSVFEIIPDLQNAIADIDDGDYVMEATMHPIQWIKDTFDKKEPGYTGLAQSVKEDQSLSLQLTYLERLKGSTGKDGQYGLQPDLTGHAVVIECYIKPTKKFKKGLMIIVCNQKVLYINSSPYTYSDGRNWNPYTMVRYDIHPLRHHGISLVEHQVPIQKRINAIKNLEILNRMTMAVPQKLVPINCLSAGGYWNGKAGLQLYYNPAIGKPEIIQAAGLDASVYREKEEDKQALHIIAGDNEVLSGNKPAGANAASALNLLLEQSLSKFGPLIQEWERFIEAGQIKKANLIRRMYKEPRPELARRMKQINKDFTTVMVDDFFTGKDLGDNIDIRVEAGSSLPRSNVMHQENLMKLLQANVLGDLNPISNPVANQKFREEFGVSDFPTTTSNDTKRAMWENDMLRQGKSEEVEVMPEDNPLIHYYVISEEMKRPEFFINTDAKVIAQFKIHGLRHYLSMSPEQVKQAGISQVQEEYFVGLGMTLLNVMNPIERKVLEQKMAMFNPQPQPPNMGASAGLPASVSPAIIPPDISSGSPSPIQTPPEMALNTQGGIYV